jgi:hypothetical protein
MHTTKKVNEVDTPAFHCGTEETQKTLIHNRRWLDTGLKLSLLNMGPERYPYSICWACVFVASEIK